MSASVPASPWRRLGRHTGPLDVALAAALTGFLYLGTRGAADEQEPDRDIDIVTDALLSVAGLALVLTRRHPLISLAVVAATNVTYFAVGYPYGPVVFTIVAATFSAARQLPVARSLPACAAALGALSVAAVVRVTVSTDESALAALGSAAWFVLPWSIGAILRQRGEARARLRRTEAERALHDERMRMAAEVHDTAGHGLAVVAMQAGVALHLLERRPEQARAALEAIRSASQEALDGLRATLDDLRTDAPGLAGLPALVEHTRHAGLQVAVEVTGRTDELDPAAEAAAYRIVQESLTNVLRHAGASHAWITLHRGQHELTVRVRDDGTGRQRKSENGSPGRGIPGMRARAAALGGDLRADTGTAGGFEVVARLPATRARP